MALEADSLIDRQQLKRRLMFWRVVAVLALVLAAIVVVPRGGEIGGINHIARYKIEGTIGDGQEQVEAIDKLGKDASVAAVLLHLDTPGGAVGGGEGIHDAVERLAKIKPVVAVMDGTAASAGYMIGVILEAGDASGLLDKIGFKAEQLVSGPLKGQPSFTQPLSPAGRDYLQALVMDLYDQFVGLVAKGRHMDPAKVKTLADGRAYTGRQAQSLGLVDEIGGEPEALKWLQTKRNVSADLPVRDVLKGSWAQRMVQSSLDTIFVSAQRSLRVDGVWALWQPSVTRE
jgi:protease-4